MLLCQFIICLAFIMRLTGSVVHRNPRWFYWGKCMSVCMHYCSLENENLQHKARRGTRPQHNHVQPHSRGRMAVMEKPARTTETSHSSINLIAASAVKTLITGSIISTWKPQKCSPYIMFLHLWEKQLKDLLYDQQKSNKKDRCGFWRQHEESVSLM